MNGQREREISASIGQAIARHRIAAGMTQDEVAEALGIGPEAVSRLERGIVMPSIPRLVELAEVFKCSLQALIQQASDLPSDNAALIAKMMEGLTPRERQLAIDLLARTCEHFKGA